MFFVLPQEVTPRVSGCLSRWPASCSLVERRRGHPQQRATGGARMDASRKTSSTIVLTNCTIYTGEQVVPRTAGQSARQSDRGLGAVRRRAGLRTARTSTTTTGMLQAAALLLLVVVLLLVLGRLTGLHAW